MIIEVISLAATAVVSYALGIRKGTLQEALPPAEKTAPAQEQHAQFARLLEACGFRIFACKDYHYTALFDGGHISIGQRTFTKPEQEMDGWRIAYQLPHHTACCGGYFWWRLAQPRYLEYVLSDASKKETKADPGLGPRVCAKCGRIERDHDGAPDGIGGLIGRALNIFPVLEALVRRDGEYADRARLSMLERERQSLGERRDVLDLEIAQLRTRLPSALGEGPYRSALPAGTEPETKEDDNEKPFVLGGIVG